MAQTWAGPGLLLFRFDRISLVSKFSPGISPSLWICSEPSSGFVRMVRTFRHVRRCYRFPVSPSFPAILCHPHRHRLLRCRCPLLSGSGRSSIFRLVCHGVFLPNVRTCRPSPVRNVYSSGLFHRL